MDSAAPSKTPLPSYVCDDCGKGFQGDPKAHYDSNHGGMPRMRYSNGESSSIECRHSSHAEPWISTADLGDHSALSSDFGDHTKSHKKRGD